MEIILARHAGFCEGVERAYRIALNAAKHKKPVFILGDLVHNKDVAAKLKHLGIQKVRSISAVPSGATLIITAHGTTPKILSSAQKRHLKIVDTTCPWVKRAQRLAGRLADSGMQVLIVGDKGHPEVVGLLGWAKKGAKAVEDIKELKRLKLNGKAALLAQTTQSEDNFSFVAREAVKKVPSLKIFNTICGATHKRQGAAKELARASDVILVIGDPKSANTNRLTEVCRSEGVETHQIQNERELKLSFLAGKRTVGITAGASTPDYVIKKVIEKIKRHA
jgi:4-hydroxy-3-methylbut-2-enyl diphosphate reductase